MTPVKVGALSLVCYDRPATVLKVNEVVGSIAQQGGAHQWKRYQNCPSSSFFHTIEKRNEVGNP